MVENSNFYQVKSVAQFQEHLAQDLGRVSLINFWAEWAEPCTQMNEVARQLAKKYPKLLVLQVSAEEQVDIAESFDVEAVPTLIILRGHTLLDRIAGANAAAVTTSVAKHVGTESSITPLSKTSQAPAAAPLRASLTTIAAPEDLEIRLRKLMNQSKVVLFMKGNPEVPRCGFSRQAVALLNEQGVKFTSFDILTDESVRQGLKELNKWPTFPQFIVNGELIGGLDVVRDMVDNGELQEVLAV